MHRFKELEVWKRAIMITKRIYALTSEFPQSEKYGLTSQVNRSAVSVASNIAEGAGRNTNGEFKQFIGIALGSAYELQTQLIIASEIGLSGTENAQEIIEEIDQLIKMMISLKNKLN